MKCIVSYNRDNNDPMSITKVFERAGIDLPEQIPAGKKYVSIELTPDQIYDLEENYSQHVNIEEQNNDTRWDI